MGGLHEERFGERRRGVENESEGLGGGVETVGGDILRMGRVIISSIHTFHVRITYGMNRHGYQFTRVRERWGF